MIYSHMTILQYYNIATYKRYELETMCILLCIHNVNTFTTN